MSMMINMPSAQSASGDFGAHFVNSLLPHVKSFAYTWFHLQAAKRKHFKNEDKRMSYDEEFKIKEHLMNEETSVKVKWAIRLLMKLRKDIQKAYQKSLVDILTTANNHQDNCILSNPDMKGKMRRIDCLRQSDKVWRLDLVMVVLFKGIPLESSDGERLEKSRTCKNPQLCINPNHSLVSIKDLEVYLANFIGILANGCNGSHKANVDDDVSPQQATSNNHRRHIINVSSVFTTSEFVALTETDITNGCKNLSDIKINMNKSETLDDERFGAALHNTVHNGSQIGQCKAVKKRKNSQVQQTTACQTTTIGDQIDAEAKQVQQEFVSVNTDFELNIDTVRNFKFENETDTKNVSQVSQHGPVDQKSQMITMGHQQQQSTTTITPPNAMMTTSTQNGSRIGKRRRLSTKVKQQQFVQSLEALGQIDDSQSQQDEEIRDLLKSDMIRLKLKNDCNEINKRSITSKLIADELKELIQKERRTTADLVFQLIKAKDQQQQQTAATYPPNTPNILDQFYMSPIITSLLPCTSSSSSSSSSSSANASNSSLPNTEPYYSVSKQQQHQMMITQNQLINNSIINALRFDTNSNSNDDLLTLEQQQRSPSTNPNATNIRGDATSPLIRSSPTKLPYFYPSLITNSSMHRPIPIVQKSATQNQTNANQVYQGKSWENETKMTTSNHQFIAQSIRNMHNSPLMFNHFTSLHSLQTATTTAGHQTGAMTPNMLGCYPNISPNISTNGTSSPSNLFSLFQSPLATPRVTPTQNMPYLFSMANDCENYPNIFTFHQQTATQAVATTADTKQPQSTTGAIGTCISETSQSTVNNADASIYDTVQSNTSMQPSQLVVQIAQNI